MSSSETCDMWSLLEWDIISINVYLSIHPSIHLSLCICILYICILRKQKILLIYLSLAVLSLCCCAGSSLAVAAVATLRCGARAPCSGFSPCRARALWHEGFSSCGTQAQLLLGTWDLLGSETEPVSPTLTGRFFTTEPPGLPSRQIDR